MNHNLENVVVCIVGLGCVGLSLARAFAQTPQVIAALLPMIIIIAHKTFKQLKPSDLTRMQNTNPILFDVQGVYNGVEARQTGFAYRIL